MSALTHEETEAPHPGGAGGFIPASQRKTAPNIWRSNDQSRPNNPRSASPNRLKSLPGVMTIRGCAYAGSKGVVWGQSGRSTSPTVPSAAPGTPRAGRRNYYVGKTSPGWNTDTAR